MRVTAKVTGIDQLKKKIVLFPKETQRPMDRLLIQEVRTLAVECARVTLPFGFSNKAYKGLAARIASDIKRIFKRADDFTSNPDAIMAIARLAPARWDPALARQYRLAASNGDLEKARRLLRKICSNAGISIGAIRPDLHQKARTGRYGRVPDDAKPLAIISKGDALNRYIAKVQRQIGAVKAGWIAAAKKLGGTLRGIPRWANTGMHKKSQGDAVVKREAKGSRIELLNQVSYAPTSCSMANLQSAERRARVRLQNAMAERLKAMAARAFRHGK
jgi:hypothetical protein